MTAVRGLESVDWDAYDVVVLPRGWYASRKTKRTRPWAMGLYCLMARATWGIALGTLTVQRRRGPSRAPGRTRRARPRGPLTPCRNETASEATSQALCTPSWMVPTATAKYWSMKTLRAHERRPQRRHPRSDAHQRFCLVANAQLRGSLSFGVTTWGRATSSTSPTTSCSGRFGRTATSSSPTPSSSVLRDMVPNCHLPGLDATLSVFFAYAWAWTGKTPFAKIWNRHGCTAALFGALLLGRFSAYAQPDLPEGGPGGRSGVALRWAPGMTTYRLYVNCLNAFGLRELMLGRQ